MSEIIFTSLIHLIRHPDAYDQKLIKIVGYCRFDAAMKAVFIGEADFAGGVLGHGVVLHAEDNAQSRGVHDKYAMVDGIFDAKDRGASGKFAGAIKAVERIILWSDPRHPENE